MFIVNAMAGPRRAPLGRTHRSINIAFLAEGGPATCVDYKRRLLQILNP